MCWSLQAVGDVLELTSFVEVLWKFWTTVFCQVLCGEWWNFWQVCLSFPELARAFPESCLASAFRKFSGSVGISVGVLVQLCWTVLRSSELVSSVSSSSSSSNWWNIVVFVCIFAFVFDLYCIHRSVLVWLCIDFLFDSVFLFVLCWSLNSLFSAKTAISGH